MRKPVETGSAIVVKIGSSSLTSAHGGIDHGALQRIVRNIGALWDEGHPAMLVTSGAVSAGLPVLGLSERPSDLAGLQVAAAAGQVELMAAYAAAFGERRVAQVLLTRDVLARREQYLHAREALDRMLTIGVVPIVNENDTVVVDELRFGDNDRLAAILAHLVGAGMMILLTDTSGIFPADPRLGESGGLLSAVRFTDEVLDDVRKVERAGRFGSGGVATKIAAAQIAAWSGIPTVVANASTPDVTLAAVRGEEVGTWIEPRPKGLPARKLWIAFGLVTGGNVEVDRGAARALVHEGSSLLAVGITSAEGTFSSGAAIEIRSEGELLAKGITQIASADLDPGTRKQGAVVVHRDDLVVLQ